MLASSICNTIPLQLSSPHQSTTLTRPDLFVRIAACSNSTILAWSSVTRSLLLFLPTPLSLSRVPPPDRPVSLWLVVFFTPSFSVLSCHSIFLSFSPVSFPSTFYLSLFFLSPLCSPPSIFPSPPPVSSPPPLSPSLSSCCVVGLQLVLRGMSEALVDRRAAPALITLCSGPELWVNRHKKTSL